ncbi:nucleotidyl transferase AbiEii/AbiGii toxin family protein [Streptomyces longisporoflavus]|uniref:Nucleotidyl transferase AbiEii/AbiGii toxin family protein n=1 Tax=Streptomyces longisporoflavus TaxID=28044 RepID=A0ABW7R4F3_9ACTN
MATPERRAGPSGCVPRLGATWQSQPTAARHHIEAIAILLYSFRRALAPGSWYLKGSAALTAWIGPAARPPNDLDLVIPAWAGRRLLASGALPPGPGGEPLRITRHEPVIFSSPAKATVYRALVDIGGPQQLPPVLAGLVLQSESDPADSGRTTLLDFPGPAGAVTVPSVTGYRFLTQKLLRYVQQRSGGRVNTRWWDLSDMLQAVSHPAFPALRLDRLRQDLALEVAGRALAAPAGLPAPPAEWLDFWDAATFANGWPFGRLPEAADRLSHFWEPVLRPSPQPTHAGAAATAHAVWTPDAQGWIEPTATRNGSNRHA